jgi:LysM repeat protein
MFGRALTRPMGIRVVALLMLVGVLLTVSAAPVSAQQRRHTVRPGETLAIIAAYYNTTWPAIAQANNLSNPNLIYVGQMLIIPATGGPVTGGRTYTVQRGDQLRFIAARFGTTWQAIAQANGLNNPNLIYVGQVLIIPGTGGPVVPPPVSGNRYVVQPGDTLFRIAARLGVNVYDLAEANGILNLNRIYAGQVLIVPY